MIKILFDGDLINPEIEFSASSKELIYLGHQLRVLTHGLELAGENSESKYYPEYLKSITFQILDKPMDMVAIHIQDKKLFVVSSQNTINDLGHSLLNVFDESSQTNTHFHLDYFDNDIQKASLIILCRN